LPAIAPCFLIIPSPFFCLAYLFGAWGEVKDGLQRFAEFKRVKVARVVAVVSLKNALKGSLKKMKK
jgi:hypothetical protein